MPDSDNQNKPPDFNTVIKSVKYLIKQLMIGDIALRRVSILNYGRLRWMPVILVARQLKSKLKFTAAISRNKEIFFGIFGQKNEQAVAFFRINIGLEPVPGVSDLVSLKTAICWMAPFFLELENRSDVITLRLSDQRRIQIRLSPDSKIERLAIDGKPSDLTKLDLPLVVSILETVAGWQRDVFKGNRLTIQLPAGNGIVLEGILSKIALGFEEIYETLRIPLADTDIGHLHRYFSHIHPDLGATYRFRDTYARLLTWIDRNGAIVSPKEVLVNENLKEMGVQQVDVEAHVFQNPQETELRLSLRLPDFLVGGPYHPRFADAIRQDSVRKKVIEQLKDQLSGGVDLTQFLINSEHDQDTIFARIDYGTSQKSRDLVLIKGIIDRQIVQCLFEMTFKVSSYPEVKIESVEDIKLLYGNFMTHRPDIDSVAAQRIRRYLAGLFSILKYWQSKSINAAIEPSPE